MSVTRLPANAVVRRTKKVVGVFIDGPALDRASKRINRKIDLKSLVRVICSGLEPSVLRYYTLIPHEDDSRHRAFLNAVSGAGLEVVVKRLPPKGVGRQVSIDVELVADMVAFGAGLSELPSDEKSPSQLSLQKSAPAGKGDSAIETIRSVVVVCPSRDIAYPLHLLKQLKVETIGADFGKFSTSDILKSTNRTIDLSSSESIWRD